MVSLALPAYRAEGNGGPLPGAMCALIGFYIIPESFLKLFSGRLEAVGDFLTGLSALANIWLAWSFVLCFVKQDASQMQKLPSWTGIVVVLLAAHPLAGAAVGQDLSRYMLGYYVWVLALAAALGATLFAGRLEQEEEEEPYRAKAA